MSEYDSFEDRLRAMADEINRSVQRMSEVDLEGLVGRYGIDADRARNLADVASQWLSDHLSPAAPFFGDGPDGDFDRVARHESAGADAHVAEVGARSRRPGPHPLDLPAASQGVALSALDSGRWTVRPGSGQLDGTGEGTPPSEGTDLVSELRARDWITADGTLTLVGRHALARWCRTAEEPAPPPPEPTLPST
ncbi:MAG: hypothetical protein ACRDPM_23010 [Solirubrobacteraceae bacterium]